jgi:predicted nuclease with TOPRIM domain
MNQSRLENEELEARLQEKQKNKKEIIERSLQIQKEYEKQSEELSDLRQQIVQENMTRQKIADELD